MERKTHYFWAVRLPDETKHFIYTMLEKEKDVFQFKRWVHELDYHITLAFLGNANIEQLEASVAYIQKALLNETSFSLAINHIGTFGKRNSPRIFWGGMAREERLYQLQILVFNACLQAGFTLEKRPFAPHITLARNWNGEDFISEWLTEHNPFKHEEIIFTVKEVVLYKTNIGAIPKYEAIANLLLKDE